MITVIAILIVILFVAIFVARNGSSAETETLKIGAALALTGDAAPWGEESQRAAILAIEEINAAGGIDGKKLDLVVEDMRSSSKDSVTAISKLVNVDKVNAAMITWLDSYPGSEAVVPKNMPLISQDAAIESVNTPVNHSNVFSLWYRTSAKASVIVGAMKDANVKKVYIVLQHDPYYTKLAEFLNAEALKQGIFVVDQEFVNPGGDSRTIIAKISGLKPDAVFFGSYDEKLSVDFFKRYSEQIGNKIALYGDEFIEQDLDSPNFRPAWLEGVKYYVPAIPEESFVEKFAKKYGRGPKFSAGTTYDTVYILAKYLKDMPVDVSSYMKQTKFSTITYGEIRFDEVGGVVSDKSAIAMKKISGGKSVPIR